MAEIIDQVKVGLFIKALLKEKLMTQDDLAKTLNITKAAVSQNLNGKSAFDIQNLVRIAELFKMSLDDLLACRKPSDLPAVDSEYLRLIKRGLADFKTHTPTTLNIATADVYGKYLIDYLIEQSLHDWIQYIVEQKIVYVKPTDQYHRVMTEKLILYVLRHQVTSPAPLIVHYVATYGQLKFAQDHDLQEFLLLLEKHQPKALIQQLFTEKNKFVKPHQILFIRWQSSQMNGWMHGQQLVAAIIRYQLLGLWTTWLDLFVKTKNFFQLEGYFALLAQADFLPGLQVLLEKIPKANAFLAFQSQPLATALRYLVKKGQENLLTLAISKNLLDSYNEVALMMIEEKQEEMLFNFLTNYPLKLTAKKLVVPLTVKQGFSLMEKLATFFSSDVLSFALDHLPLEQATPEVLQGLIKIGAQFQPQYMNRFTSEKMNRLLTKSKKGKN